MSVILVDEPIVGLRRILINRPKKRNAIDFQVRQEMTEALLAARSDCRVRAVVLGGVGGVFSAGGDLDSMGDLDETQARDRMQHIHHLCRVLAHMPIPVVSAVEGFCAGAAVGMSLLSDFIVVDKNSKILFPFMGLGLVPDWGAMLTLPRRVGAARARQLMTSGKVSDGSYCYEIGLADELAENQQVMKVAIAHAEEFSKLPQDVFARFKQRLNHPSLTLDEELQREEDDQAVLLLGAEFKLGYSAVMNKSKAPDFTSLSREVKPHHE